MSATQSTTQNFIDRLFGTADRAIGEEGIRTDVKITLDASTYINLGVAIILATIIGNALNQLIFNKLLGK